MVADGTSSDSTIAVSLRYANEASIKSDVSVSTARNSFPILTIASANLIKVL